MKEVKTPKKPLIYYYGIVLLVLIVYRAGTPRRLAGRRTVIRSNLDGASGRRNRLRYLHEHDQ